MLQLENFQFIVVQHGMAEKIASCSELVKFQYFDEKGDINFQE